MKTLSIPLAVLLIATAAAASAQSATDARCIVLTASFANHANNANQQKIAEDSLYFYLGRVGGQPNSAQFKAALDAQAKTITDASAATLMAQCVAAVKAKVQLLQSIATPSPKAPPNPQGR